MERLMQKNWCKGLEKVFELSLVFCDFSAHRPTLYSFPEARVSELGCLGRISYLVPQPWLIDSDLQTLDRVPRKKQCTLYSP